MRALHIDLSPEEIVALDEIYRTTKDVRLRTRSQMILLAGEQRMPVSDIARIVRHNEQTVRNWLQRYQAEGVARYGRR